MRGRTKFVALIIGIGLMWMGWPEAQQIEQASLPNAAVRPEGAAQPLSGAAEVDTTSAQIAVPATPQAAMRLALAERRWADGDGILASWTAAHATAGGADGAKSETDAMSGADEQSAAFWLYATEALRRGRQREYDFRLESPVLIRVGAWTEGGIYGIGVTQKRAVGLRRDYRDKLLTAEWPRQNDVESIAEWLAECALLHIQGLEIPATTILTAADIAQLQSFTHFAGPGLAQWDAAAIAALAAMPHVQELDLRQITQPAPTSRILSAFSGHQGLRRVVCAANSGDRVEDVAALVSMSNLEVVSIGGGRGPSASLVQLGQLTNLRELTIINQQVDGDTLRAIANGCVQLQQCNFDAAPQSAQGMQALGGLAELTTVTVSVHTDAEALALRSWTQLRDVTVVLSVSADGGVTSLAGLDQFAVLESLSLRLDGAANFMTDQRCVGFGGLTTLRTLRLEGPAVNDACLRAVLTIPSCERLEISQAAVTDVGVATVVKNVCINDLSLSGCDRIQGTTLQDIMASPGLQTLRFTDCPLTEAAFLAVSKPGGLERLSIQRCPVFTEASVRHVASWARRPKIDLDVKLLSKDAQQELRKLSDAAVSGSVVVTEEANSF